MSDFEPTYSGEVPSITRMNIILCSNDPLVDDREVGYAYCFDDEQARLAATNSLLYSQRHIMFNMRPNERIKFEKYSDEEEKLEINDVDNYAMLPPGDIVCYYQFKMSYPFNGCHYQYGHVFFVANRDKSSLDWPIIALDMPGKYGKSFIRWVKEHDYWSKDIKDEPTGRIEEGLCLSHFQRWMSEGDGYRIDIEDCTTKRPIFFGNPASSHGESGNIIAIMASMNEFSQWKYMWQCDCCWNYYHEKPAGYTGSHGTGGVGVEHTGPYCSICDTSAACSKCGAQSRDYLTEEKCYNCGQRCFCCGTFDKDLTTETLDDLLLAGALDEDTTDEHGENVSDQIFDDLDNQEMIEVDKVRYKNVLAWALDTTTELHEVNAENVKVCAPCDYAQQLRRDKEEHDKIQMKLFPGAFPEGE